MKTNGLKCLCLATLIKTPRHQMLLRKSITKKVVNFFKRLNRSNNNILRLNIGTNIKLLSKIESKRLTRDEANCKKIISDSINIVCKNLHHKLLFASSNGENTHSLNQEVFIAIARMSRVLKVDGVLCSKDIINILAYAVKIQRLVEELPEYLTDSAGTVSKGGSNFTKKLGLYKNKIQQELASLADGDSERKKVLFLQQKILQNIHSKKVPYYIMELIVYAEVLYGLETKEFGINAIEAKAVKELMGVLNGLETSHYGMIKSFQIVVMDTIKNLALFKKAKKAKFINELTTAFFPKYYSEDVFEDGRNKLNFSPRNFDKKIELKTYVRGVPIYKFPYGGTDDLNKLHSDFFQQVFDGKKSIAAFLKDFIVLLQAIKLTKTEIEYFLEFIDKNSRKIKISST